jgi:hypothetical protein
LYSPHRWLTSRIVLGVTLLLLVPELVSAAPIIYPINIEFPVVLTLERVDPTDAVRITLDLGAGHGPGQVVSPGEPVLAMGWAGIQPELSTVAPGMHAPIVLRMSSVDDPSTFVDYVVPLDPLLAAHASHAWWAHYVLEGTGQPGAGRFNPVLSHVPGVVSAHELAGTFAIRAIVPEPAALGLLAFGAAAFFARRRRHARTHRQ